MKLSFDVFKGTAPKISPYQLPESYGQLAADTKLWSGALKPFYEDTFIEVVPNDTKSIYKYKHPTLGDSWYYWNRDVSVVKGPVYDDENNRIIISGLDGGLRTSDATYLNNPQANTIDSTNSIRLAIPVASGVKMAVTGSGTANTETRSYVVSFVREWQDGKLDIGKTSSPATTASGDVTVNVSTGQAVLLTNIVLPAESYNTSRVRKCYVYRSTVSSSGTAEYRYVGQFTVNNETTVYTFNDNVSTLNLGEAAVSVEWDAPIDTLTGIVSLNNGVMAAYSGNDVYFSYPYQTSAWPYTYRVTVDWDIKGLGSFGNTVVVCTDAAPVLILCSDPSTASVTPIHENIPCISSRSIVSTSFGVIFATYNGLVLINSSSPTYITDSLISRDEWRTWNPESLTASYYDGTYFGIFTNPAKEFGFMLDLNSIDLGIVNMYSRAYSTWSDLEESTVYMLRPIYGGQIAIVQFDSDTQLYKPYKWRSKIYVSPEGLFTLSAARVKAQYSSQDSRLLNYVYTANNGSLNTVAFNTSYLLNNINLNVIYDYLHSTTSTIFRYYIDGQLRYSRVCTDNKPFRIPSGFRGETVEIEIEASIPVSYVDIASSMGELR